MNALLPRAVLPYAKAWVGLIGAVVAAILVTWDDAPRWVTVVSAALTAAGVYLTPNTDPAGEHQDESVQPTEQVIPGTTLDVLPRVGSIDVPQSSDTKADADGGSTSHRALNAKQTDQGEW